MFDNMHLFSFRKDIEGDVAKIIEFDREKCKIDKQERDYHCKLIRRFTSKSTVNCEPIEGKMDTDSNDDNDNDSNCIKTVATIFDNMQSAEFRAQGFNILNKERCLHANYAQMSPRDDAYYNTKDIGTMKEYKQDGVSLGFPDLKLMQGFTSSVLYGFDQPMVKIGMARKLITAHPVYDFIRKCGVDKVHGFILGKRGLTNYSNPAQIVPLDGLDKSKNMKSTFKRRIGKEFIDITFESYYKNKGVRLYESGDEPLIKSYGYYRNGKRIKIDEIENKKQREGVEKRANFYLPGTIHVIVPMEQQNDNTKQEMRQTSHPPAHEIIDNAIRINKELNAKSRSVKKFFDHQTQREGQRERDTFQTLSEPFKTTAYELISPSICFKGIYMFSLR